MKNAELVYLVTLLAGGIILQGSWLLPPGLLRAGLQEILSGLGTALLASAFIGFFNKRYLTDEKPDLRKEWGFKEIYEFRRQKDAKTNERIKNGAKELDCIVQGGLDGLRNNMDVNLHERISGGLKIRLLIPKNPYDQEMKDANEELEKWYHSLNDKQKRNVAIRKYSGIPQDLYFRLDEMVFVGPYFANSKSAEDITYEFDRYLDGGKLYANYFENLWGRSKGEEIR
jgi:hypothetical protein